MQKCIGILHDDVNYYDDIYADYEQLFNGVCRDVKRKYKVEYYNIPVTFDIETTSFYEGDEKRACMYIWMFSIDDHIIIGRTWDEFLFLCEKLKEFFSLDPDIRRMVVYVQSLGFEFQFISGHFTWEKVFALDNRIPLTALNSLGIEFRCSYRLSGYNLAKMGDGLLKYKVSKMVGDLDYKLYRHSKTPLTDTELGYCINDVRVLSAYIREKLENEGGITKIPLTKTGYVRNYCRSTIYGKAHTKGRQYKNYRGLMESLVMTPDEFRILQQCFQGGFTHANPFYSGRTLDKNLLGDNIVSFDFNSSYPTQMVAEMFPMGAGELYEVKDKKDLKYQLSHYCCMFVCRFTGLKSRFLYDNYISYSKCRNVSKPVLNNGRIVSADSLETTITELDYDIIRRCYTWTKFEIAVFYRYKKGYLPTEFIDCVLSFYETKTTLKNVDGKESEYLQGKENLNSCYGMCVTNPAKPIITFDEEWTSYPLDLEKEIQSHNKKTNRFLFYPWGVWVTAHARYKLWNYGILKLGKDYVYSDTDSIKFINPGLHTDFIKQYNTMKKLLKAMRYHGMDPKRICPHTIKNAPKPLGVWECDGIYDRFKTLGAKRYLVEYRDGSISATIAGLNKKAGKRFLIESGDPFNTFCENMYVPSSRSDKMTATYIDYETEGVLTDYMGVPGKYHELSSLNLDPAPYELGVAADYSAYILGIGEME